MAMITRQALLALTIMALAACGGKSDGAGPNTSSSSGPKYLAAPQHGAALPAFSGPRNSYSITRESGAIKVTSVSDGSVTNLDASTGSIQFSDMTVNLAIGTKAASISAADLKMLIDLYLAYFNRVPDAEGLGYWIDQSKAGMTLEQIGQSFYDAAVQYSSLTGYSSTMTNADFVKIIYKNVLGRTSVDQAGLDYWTGALAKGTETRGTLVKSILNSAHTFKGDATYGYVADLLDNKGSTANYFAVQQGLGYNTGSDSISKGMSIASAVTASGMTAATKQIGVSDTLFNLAPDCMTPAVLQNGVCVSPANLPPRPQVTFEISPTPAGTTYSAVLCWSGSTQCDSLGQAVYVSREEYLEDKGEVNANVSAAQSIAAEFNNMIGRLWKAKTIPPNSTMLSAFRKAVQAAIASEDGSRAVPTAAAEFSAAGYPAAGGGGSTSGSSEAASDSTGGTCGLSNYKGPSDDLQYDSFCQNAYMNTCLDQAAGTAVYKTQTASVCSILDSMLRSTGGGSAVNYCGYCR